MNTVELTHDLDVSAIDAWAVLADFPGFLKWAGGGEGTIEIEGTGVGMVRHLNMPGTGKMAERLDRLDDDTTTIGYSLMYGNPVGMAEYRAVVRLEATEKNACRIHWHGEFTPAEDQQADVVRGNLEAAYQGMAAALAAYVKAG